MKILVYTGYDENPKYEMMGNVSSFNKLVYCQKHGYSFLSERDYFQYQRNISWFKIGKILQLLDNYDWIAWFDADTLINNMEQKLEDFIISDNCKKNTYLRVNEMSVETPLEPSKEKWFICSDDEWANLGPCLGGFLIKNCPESKKFLTDVYNYTKFENHNWWDQAAAHQLWFDNREYRDGLKVLSRVFLNSFSDFKQDSFLIHDKFHIENGKIVPK